MKRKVERVIETMGLYEALKVMRDSSKPFSVEFCTYSKTRQTGGEIKRFDNVLVAGQQDSDVRNMMMGFKRVDDADAKPERCYIHSIMYFNGIKLII
jgi:hypothetical protein